MTQQVVRDLKDLGQATGSPAAKKARPPFWDTKSMPIRLDRIVAFISYYQRKHEGQTPSKRTIANEMEDSEEAVQYWLNRLENIGHIHVVSRAPLRLMVRVTPPDLESARRMDNALKGSKIGWEVNTAKERFDAAEAQRFRIAHFIGSYWQQNEKGPTLGEIATAVGMSGPGYVTGALQVLEERHLITFNPDVPRSARLTEDGRMATGFVGIVAEKPRAPAQPRPTTTSRAERLVVAQQARAKRSQDRIDEVHRWMVDFAKERGRMPDMGETAVHFEMGTGAAPNAAHIFYALKDRGLIRDHKPKTTYRKATLLDTDGNVVAPSPLKRLSALRRASPKAAAAYDAAVQFVIKNGRYPLAGDVYEAIGLKRNGSHRHIERLQRFGLLVGQGKGVPGMIVMLNGKPMLGKQKEEDKVQQEAKPARTKGDFMNIGSAGIRTLRQLAGEISREIERVGTLTSAAELATRMGWKSDGAVHNAIRRMEHLGWITADHAGTSGRLRLHTARLTERGQNIAASVRGLTQQPVAEARPEPTMQEEPVEPMMVREPDPREPALSGLTPGGTCRERPVIITQSQREITDAVRERIEEATMPELRREEVDLAAISDKDLVFELTMRGFVVERRR